MVSSNPQPAGQVEQAATVGRGARQLQLPSLLAAIFTLVFLWMVLATFPLPPEVPSNGLDGSWRRALAMAHAQNLVFGKDIAFTFGPLGYLFYPVPGLVDPFAIFACSWAFYGVFLCGALLIWRAFGHHWVVLASWLTLVASMLFLTTPFERMQLSFLSLAAGILALVAQKGKAATGYLVFAGIVAGAMPLFKTNEGVTSCATFYLLLAACILARETSWRRLALPALVPPLTFVAGYLIEENSIAGLGSYVVRSMQIALGYSEAMALPGSDRQAAVAAGSLAVLCIAIPLVASGKRRLLAGLLPVIVAGFFLFKSAIVRQDEWHTPSLWIKLPALALLLLVCTSKLRDRLLMMAYAIASFYIGIFLYQADPVQTQTAVSRALLRGALKNLVANADYPVTWDRMTVKNEQELDGLHVEPAVSELVNKGTVDDVPSELDVVEANGWHWKPRPVFQAYSAYTPGLDQWNARSLASPDSADHILMQWEDIDGRYPLLDDPASWRALFDHYDVEAIQPKFLVLKRRHDSRYGDAQPLGSRTTSWQTDTDIPAPPQNGFVMMRVEIAKSLYGALRGFLFRNSATYLNATYSSGRNEWHRVTRANLPDGAFVTYLPWKLNELLPYFGKPADGQADRVTSIRFVSPGLSEFSPEIHISWFFVPLR